jgi:hypothetical protein
MKLNRTELGVLARRLADELTEINIKRVKQEAKLADIKNAKMAAALLKKVQQLPPEMKKVIQHHSRISLDRLTIDEVLATLRPPTGDMYVRAHDVMDQLVIDQIACPDVTELLQRVRETFLAKSKPANP